MANKIQLRDYQIRGIEQLNDAIKLGNKRICWVFPTGAGKSTIASSYVKMCVNARKKVLFFVHSKELVVQFAQRLYKQFGIDSGIIMAGVKPSRQLPVQVASVQTLVRRQLPKADIIFIDEAHRSKAKTYQKVIDNYPNAIIVGLTATPFRTDGQGLGDIFETIVHPVKIRELIQKGFLVPTKVYTSAQGVDMSGVKTIRGEYDNQEMMVRFSDNKVTSGVIQNYLKHANGKKAIAFNVNVQHSIEMNALFNKQGIASAHLDGTTDKKTRERIVRDFSKGKYQVLQNVGLFIEGFDVPDTECVILNHATSSLGRYVQEVGRGLRPAKGKDNCTVLDHGDNTIRHGFVEDYDGLPFTLEGVDLKSKSKKKREAKTKVCDNCFAVNPNNQRNCRECNEPFPIKERTVEFTDGTEFIAIERDALIIDRLLNLPYKKIKGGIPASQLRLFAILRGYKSKWWFHTAIDYGYVQVNKSHPNAFDQVLLLLKMEEIKAGTHELYKQIRIMKVSKAA